MRSRCSNPSNASWRYYGARGITVCDRWRLSFAAFLADMGPKPTPRHQIDRKDGTLGYFPSNCRWATPKEQVCNRHTYNRNLTHDGRTQCVQAWADETGIPSATIHSRLKEFHWTVAQALTIRPNPLGRRGGGAAS